MPQDATPERPATAEPRAALLVALLVLASLFGLFSRGLVLTDVPNHTDGIYGQIGRNYLKYGYPEAGLAQIVSPGPPLPRAERLQYQTHLPLAPFLSSVSFAVLGPGLWQGRLVHVLCGLAVVVVLARLAARLYGWRAGAWTAIFAACLPAAALYGSAFPSPNGPAMILCTSLAALWYQRHAESGSTGALVGLCVACVVGCLADWPAYIVPFVLATHAIVYRTRARRLAVVCLPVMAVAAFAVFWFYATSIPPERQLYHSVTQAIRNWTVAEKMIDAPVPSMREVVVRLGTRYATLLSPLALLAPMWLLWRGTRALLHRDPSPAQHVALLWLWPMPFVAVFHRSSYVHPSAIV